MSFLSSINLIASKKLGDLKFECTRFNQERNNDISKVKVYRADGIGVNTHDSESKAIVDVNGTLIVTTYNNQDDLEGVKLHNITGSGDSKKENILEVDIRSDNGR